MVYFWIRIQDLICAQNNRAQINRTKKWSPCACGLLSLFAFIAVPVLPVTCVAFPFGFSGLSSGHGRELIQPREPFSVMLGTWGYASA